MVTEKVTVMAMMAMVIARLTLIFLFIRFSSGGINSDAVGDLGNDPAEQG